MITRSKKRLTSLKRLDLAAADETDEYDTTPNVQADLTTRADVLAKEASAESDQLKHWAQDELGSPEVKPYVHLTKDGLLKQLADVKLRGALRAKSDWSDARQHGVGEVGATVQRFATGLAHFIGAYSGIVEAVKCAGGPYGAAGYQAISVLLVVRHDFRYEAKYNRSCLLFSGSR